LVKLHVPGNHSILNSLAAIAVAAELGISFDLSREALARFQGVDRRFQVKAKTSDFLVVDDYAHHPSEIRTTLQAARSGWNKRILAVFQPHRYSRLYHLMDDFAGCFDLADIVVLTEIYAAGEKPIADIDVDHLAKKMNHPNLIVHKDLATLPEKVLSIAKPGDLILFLGAGNITAVADRTAKLVLEKTPTQ
ncbi:MAG TPA: cyanophycin synthetase, partial [Acidobacteriota bacterium]|nr:cyanophycin synthetase [Acidobacteriota bacterium]